MMMVVMTILGDDMWMIVLVMGEMEVHVLYFGVMLVLIGLF